MRSAVLLITFNRLHYTKEVFAEIAKAKPPRFYIACDGPRPNKKGEKEVVEELRTWLLANISWECEISTRFLETNSGGCRNGVSSAITWFFSHEPEGIILEDDCVPSQSFFTFCDELLEKYRENKSIFEIAGFTPLSHPLDTKDSYYFEKMAADCWGWATWSDRWASYPLDYTTFQHDEFTWLSDDIKAQMYWMSIFHNMEQGSIDSWAYEWLFCGIKQKGLTIISTKNLITNIGDVGVHYNTSEGDPDLHQKRYEIDSIIHPKDTDINQEATDAISQAHFTAGKITKSDIRAYKKWYPDYFYKKFYWRLLFTYYRAKSLYRCARFLSSFIPSSKLRKSIRAKWPKS